MAEESKPEMKLTEQELLYAATARCKGCGAGLAYPLDFNAAMKLRAWVCSRVLKGEVAPGGHEALPFAFWKVREETSINNRGGDTTRPAGTIARTVGKATCPKCQHTWKSEPYSACGLSHHWMPGPCPKCGYAVGGGLVTRSDEGEPIRTGYPDVVLPEPAKAEVK
jgi:ssDNA-binding Zn-finger/Zn-ribbon topoisomerase 1